MTQKKFWDQNCNIWVSKNAEFNADFESIENVAKYLVHKKISTLFKRIRTRDQTLRFIIPISIL
jgi:hypothetical protein